MCLVDYNILQHLVKSAMCILSAVAVGLNLSQRFVLVAMTRQCALLIGLGPMSVCFCTSPVNLAPMIWRAVDELQLHTCFANLVVDNGVN